MKLKYNNNCGGYDRDLACYINCLTDSGGKLWKIKEGKAYSAKYGEGMPGKALDDGSVPYIDGCFECETGEE